jgi:hypothetical protein
MIGKILLIVSLVHLFGVSIVWGAGQKTFIDWHEAHGGHEKATPVWTLPKATAPENMVWDIPSMPGDTSPERFFTGQRLEGPCFHSRL